MDIPNEIHLDAFNLLCGDKLGEGIHRIVFECRLRPDLVVKVEKLEPWRYFSNVHEMTMWNHADAKAREWLAPCEYLSPDGRVLLQRKVNLLNSFDTPPNELPSFLGDIKRANYGWFEGRFVCVDYGLVTLGKLNMKKRKVSWE